MAGGINEIAGIENEVEPTRPAPPVEMAQESIVRPARPGIERQEPVPADEALRREPAVEDTSRERLREIADAFADVVSVFNKRYQIEVDEGTDRFVTKIVDRETNEVLRQIPPEELMRIAKRLRDLVGILLDVEI